MRKTIVGAAVALVIVLAPSAAPAQPANGDAGRQYGQHVALHAHAHGGFTGEANPGVHHGFAGHDEHHDHGMP